MKVFRECELHKNPEKYFTGDQYILGDTAYQISTSVITPFRTTKSLTSSGQSFNTKHSRSRVQVEYVIGRLKHMFSSLNELTVLLSCDARHQFICDWILVCGIIYNFREVQKGKVFSIRSDGKYANPDTLGHWYDGETKRKALLDFIMLMEQAWCSNMDRRVLREEITLDWLIISNTYIIYFRIGQQ